MPSETLCRWRSESGSHILRSRLVLWRSPPAASIVRKPNGFCNAHKIIFLQSASFLGPYHLHLPVLGFFVWRPSSFFFFCLRSSRHPAATWVNFNALLVRKLAFLTQGLAVVLPHQTLGCHRPSLRRPALIHSIRNIRKGCGAAPLGDEITSETPTNPGRNRPYAAQGITNTLRTGHP